MFLGYLSTADIFSLIAEHSDARNAPSASRESELLFVGSKQAGKSTLINSFINREDTLKSTTALEYRFARRSTGANGAAAVCNIWELGGGTQLSELLKVVMLQEKLESCVIAITLDLSSAGDALGIMLFWFDQVRKHVKMSLEQVSSSQKTLSELAYIFSNCLQLATSGSAGAEKAAKIRELSLEMWREHPDESRVLPLGVPVVVLAHKWDAFEEEFGEAEYRKMLTRVLRYFAHANGASLICTKHKDKQFAEEAVDELRRSKQEEVHKLRKQQELEARLAEAAMVA
ncbi:MAG: hypothetical protein SGPRY_000394 [Prymnesium sp.]